MIEMLAAALTMATARGDDKYEQVRGSCSVWQKSMSNEKVLVVKLDFDFHHQSFDPRASYDNTTIRRQLSIRTPHVELGTILPSTALHAAALNVR